MKWEDWILPIGILAIGGYFVYNYFKNSAAGQVLGGVASGVGTIASGVGTIANTAGQVVEGVTTPIVPVTTPMGVTSPTPLEMSMPILALPKFIDTFVLDNQGKINPMVAPIKAVGDFAATIGVSTPKKEAIAVKHVPKPKVPIVTKSSAGIKVLKPLEIVKTAQAIKTSTSTSSLHGTKSKYGFTIGGR